MSGNKNDVSYSEQKIGVVVKAFSLYFLAMLLIKVQVSYCLLQPVGKQSETVYKIRFWNVSYSTFFLVFVIFFFLPSIIITCNDNYWLAMNKEVLGSSVNSWQMFHCSEQYSHHPEFDVNCVSIIVYIKEKGLRCWVTSRLISLFRFK